MSQETQTLPNSEQTILIIDDNPTNSRIVADYLEEYGYTILVAQDGENGLDKARSGQPDLILLGVVMPSGTDSFEICRRLKADKQTQDIPVIFMIQLANIEDKVKCFTAGAVDYVTKPVQQEELMARIKTHLQLRSLTHSLQEELGERERAEATLHEVSELQQAIVDNADYTIISTTPEGVITSFNPAAEQLLGYTAEEMVAQQTPAVFHDPEEVVQRAKTFSVELGQTIEPGFEVFVAKARQRLPNEYEWTYIHKSGRRIPVQLAVTGLWNKTGQVTGFLGIATDITDRKEAEVQLAKQATELSTVSKISTAVSTITDPQTMLQDVVDLTKANFGLYHAHIYLLNEVTENLVLAAGAGEVGQKMVGQGWQIPLTRQQSLVAQAARLRQGVIANDVRERPDYFQNPDLPHTLSELVVPLIAGEKLLGVLDVQADTVDRFSDDDVSIQTTLAAQVAVALQNARSFERSEETLRELNVLTRRLSQEGWTEYLADEQTVAAGYGYDLQQVTPLLDYYTRPDDMGIVQPLLIQGETIGELALSTPQTLTTEAAEIVAAVGSQLSAHLENLRLSEQTEIALAETQALYNEAAIWDKVNQALVSEPDLNIALQVVTNIMVENFDVAFARLWTLDNSKEMLLLKASSGLYTHIDGGHAQVPVGKFKIGLIAEERQAHLTNDILNDPRLGDPAWAKREGMVAFAGYPLLIGERLIGVLAMFARQPLSNEILTLLGRLADRVAVAIDNRQLFEQTEMALAETRALYEVGQALTTAPDIEQGLVETLQILINHGIVSSAASLVLTSLEADEQNDPTWAEVVAFLMPDGSASPMPPGTRFYLPEIPMSQIWQQNPGLLVFEDVRTDERLDPVSAQLYQDAGNLCSVLMTMKSGPRWIGQLSLSWPEPQHFSERDEQMFRALMGQVATVLDNQRLFIQTQEALLETEAQAQRLAQLNEMSGELNRAIFLDEIFEIAVTNTPEIIAAQRMSVTMLHQMGEYLEVVAISGEENDAPIGTRIEIEGSAMSRALLGNRVIHSQGDPMKSVMVVPLLTTSGPIGTLNVGHREADQYNEQDESLLQQIGSLVGSSIENKRLLNQTQEALAESGILYDVSRAMTDVSASDRGLTALIEALHQNSIALDVSALTLLGIHEDVTGKPEWVDIISWWLSDKREPPYPVGTTFPVGGSNLAELWSSETDRPIFIEDVRTDERLDEVTRQQYLQGEVTIATVLMPLKISDHWIGLLSLSWPTPHTFSELEQRIFQALMEQFATVVDNRRLFQETEIARIESETLAERLVQLNEMSRALALADSEQAVLDVAAAQVTKIIQGDRASIALRSPDVSFAEVVALQGEKGALSTEARVPLEGSGVGLCIRENRIVSFANLEDNTLLELSELAKQGINSIVIAPLEVQGQVVGTLNVGSVQLNAYSLRDEDLMQQFASILSSALTNRRLFEQIQQRAAELQETTTFLDSVLEYLPTMLFVKDAEDLRFVRWNKAGEELLGYKREDMVGKNDYDFFPKEEADFFVSKDREVLYGGELVDIPEETIQTAQRGTRVLHTRKMPIMGTDGEPKYLLGISEDITDRKEAESERNRLLDEVERLAAIVENHPDFIGVGTLQGEALYVNPAGLEMMGYPRDYDVTTMDASKFYPAAEAQRLIETGLPIALQEGSWSAETQLLRMDGTIVAVEQTIGINYDTSGQPYSFSITMRDISNRKAAEQERERLLEEAQAAYQQFVQREWEQVLGEQHGGHWQVEHQDIRYQIQQLDGQYDDESKQQLSRVQDEVLKEGRIKSISKEKTNGNNGEAALVAPITLRGQVIGTLGLQDIAPDRKWTLEEIALVETVSEQLAQTIENLRLFDDTQKTASREQLTREITDKMRAAPDVDTIIKTGLGELAQALGASRSYVKLEAKPK